MKLVFTWIQWCWKWTQARFLIEKYKFKLLEMWWCLREIVASKSPLGNKIKEKFEAWHLITSDIVGEIIKDVLKKETSENLILDGFVRNTWNKKTLESIIWNDYKVVFFNLSKEKAINRLLWRMFNPNTQETFQTWILIDPKTWDKLEKRKDDNEESILKRIEEYLTKTIPVIEIQKSEWKVIEINADGSIENVAKEIQNKLGLK